VLVQIERLSTAEILKRRRERRRANEKRAREVQRMQLNMVTPMDIGLERQDGVDDSDVFDLGEVEGGKVREGVKGGKLASDDEADSDDEMKGAKKDARLEAGAAMSDDEEEEGEGEGEEVSDEERKTRRLEESLDLLYETYQQSKLERDHRHKAKEARRKREAAEGGEWKGIKGPGSDSEEGSDDSDVDDDPAPKPESDDDSSDDEEFPTQPNKDADGKLITNLKKNKVLSTDAKTRQAAMWFDQPAFKGLPGGLDSLLGGSGTDEEDAASSLSDDEDEGDGVRTVWDELEEDEDDEEEGESAGEDSDDDFTGAREEFEEDDEMEEEADIDDEERKEIEKAERIASQFLSP